MEEEKKSLIKKEKKLNQEKIRFISMVVIIILIDQGTKIWIQNIQEVNIISGILQFKISENISAAYGIGSSSTLMYVVTNLIILGTIFKFITTQNQFVDMKLKIFLILINSSLISLILFLIFILAGGISNVIDKIIRGYVTEFIDFTPMIKLPVFNIADIFILIGWVAMAAIFASFTIKEWRNRKRKE